MKLLDNIERKIELEKHARYLEDHQNEYPFPLDGSDWARLVGLEKYFEHHPHCLCNECKDFYLTMHTEETRRHERAAVQRAMHYWFLQGQEHYGHEWLFAPEKDAGEKAWDLLVSLSSDPRVLAEAEKRWLAAKEKVVATPVEPGEFWNEPTSENWESRPAPNVRLLPGKCVDTENTST